MIAPAGAITPAQPRWPCRVSSDERELAGLCQRWQALCDRCPASTPFQRPDWLLPWLRWLGAAEPWILTVHADEKLVGLVPLFLYRREQHDGGERVLALMGAGVSDQLGLLLDPEHERPALASILDQLGARRADWDVCELDEQHLGSPLASGAPARDGWLAVAPGWTVTSARQSVCPLLELPARVEQLAERVPARHLQRFEQYRRRARREGALRLERAGQGADTGDRERLLDELFRLHALRWQRQGQPGVLAQPHLRAFHGQVSEAFAGRDALALYGLWLDDRLLACWYGFREGRTLCFYLSGFDPAAAHLGPGTLIVGMVIEDAIARGVTRLDFLRGSERYKYWWGATDRVNLRVSLRISDSETS